MTINANLFLCNNKKLSGTFSDCGCFIHILRRNICKKTRPIIQIRNIPASLLRYSVINSVKWVTLTHFTACVLSIRMNISTHIECWNHVKTTFLLQFETRYKSPYMHVALSVKRTRQVNSSENLIFFQSLVSLVFFIERLTCVCVCLQNSSNAGSTLFLSSVFCC